MKKPSEINILVGCEESQAVTIELRKLGFNAFSCDLKPCSGPNPEHHLQMDVFKAIQGGELITQAGTLVLIDKWHAGIFFPDCTYLTCSAEWAYKDGPYHQKVKPDTLTGFERIKARHEAIDFVWKLWLLDIENISLENPVGILSSAFIKPSQIINPWQFGDDASKKTCLWLKGFPLLKSTETIEPRLVNGKPRWANQTDSGQNKLPPTKNRAELRSKTYPGIAKAMAEQWKQHLLKT